MNYNTFIDWARENLTEEDIIEIESLLDTDNMFNTDIYELLAEAVTTVQEYKGELAKDFRFRCDYIYTRYAFEKDYFADWLEGCAVYPTTHEIIDQCKHIQTMIALWEKAAEKEWIDGEGGWGEWFARKKSILEGVCLRGVDWRE